MVLLYVSAKGQRELEGLWAPARLTEPEGLITRRKMLEGRPTNALSCYFPQWSWAGGDLFLMQPNSSSLYTQSQKYTYKRRLWYKKCFVKHSPLCAPQSKEEDLFSNTSGLWSFCFFAHSTKKNMHKPVVNFLGNSTHKPRHDFL